LCFTRIWKKYQEIEGSAIASEILERVGYDTAKTDIFSYTIENHHTPSKAEDIDFQIQWEADLLENIECLDIFNDSIFSKKYGYFYFMLQYFVNCSKIVCSVINKHIK
jgi:hypothetical protein